MKHEKGKIFETHIMQNVFFFFERVHQQQKASVGRIDSDKLIVDELHSDANTFSVMPGMKRIDRDFNRHCVKINEFHRSLLPKIHICSFMPTKCI